MNEELVGHSGCVLKIIEFDKTLYVRKESKTEKYNERLKEQCEKQKKCHIKGIKNVRILQSGTIDNKFFFDMEYISGTVLADLMYSISLEDVARIADILVYDSVQNEYDCGARKIFNEKIDCVWKSIDADIKHYYERPYRILKNYTWDNVVQTECHGDFTLENIIFSGNDLYMIDCLDSFYDSWMIDYAKILQDCELGWHYRYLKKIDNNLAIRLGILRRKLLNNVNMQKDGDKKLECIYHILLLNVLRIIPYSCDNVTNLFIYDSIEYLVNKIKRREYM